MKTHASMKKSLIFCFCLLLSVLAMAQTPKPGSLTVSVAGGPSLSNFVNSRARHLLGIQMIYNVNSEEFGDINREAVKRGPQTNLLEDVLPGFSWGIQGAYQWNKKYAISGGLFFEKMGASLSEKDADYWTYYYDVDKSFRFQEHNTFKNQVQNAYVSIPVQIRRYMRHGAFLEGGIYTAILTSSRADLFREWSYYLNDYDGYKWTTKVYNFDDVELKNTQRIDFGLTLGTGLVKNIGQHVTLEAGVSAKYGLRRLDAKYKNDIELIKQKTPWSGTDYTLISGNYYGFNSFSRNIQLALRLAVGYRF